MVSLCKEPVTFSISLMISNPVPVSCWFVFLKFIVISSSEFIKVTVSTPAPPSMISSPAPPSKVSSLASPKSVSFPVPPLSVSSPSPQVYQHLHDL